MGLVKVTNKVDHLVEGYRMFIDQRKLGAVIDEMLETTNLGTSVCVVIQKCIHLMH